MIIPGLLLYEANAINQELDSLQQQGKVQFKFIGRKIMDAWQHSPAIRQAFHHPAVLAILRFVFGKELILSKPSILCTAASKPT